jgi:tetratricopeptide (TPR) repeat protein
MNTLGRRGLVLLIFLAGCSPRDEEPQKEQPDMMQSPQDTVPGLFAHDVARTNLASVSFLQYSEGVSTATLIAQCDTFNGALAKFALATHISCGDYARLSELALLTISNGNEITEWLRVIKQVAVNTSTYSLILAAYSNMYTQCARKAERIEIQGLAGKTCKRLYDYDAALAYLLSQQDSDNHDLYSLQLRDDNLASAARIYSELLDEEHVVSLGAVLKASQNESARFSFYKSLWNVYAQQGQLDKAKRLGETAVKAFSPASSFYRPACEMNQRIRIYVNARATPRMANARIQFLKRKTFGQMTMFDEITEAIRARPDK